MLLNDPVTYHEGINFNMVINSCEKAQAIDDAYGLVSYADSDPEKGRLTCKTHAESVTGATSTSI